MDQIRFEQAGIKVQQEREFEQLRASVERVLAPASAEAFLRLVRRSGLRIRQFEAILAGGILEQADRSLAAAGVSAQQLYGALPVSDQAQMREFYLTRIEQVDPALRGRYHAQFETF